MIKKMIKPECPINDLSCPYILENGCCDLPILEEECDDYYAAIGDEENE